MHVDIFTLFPEMFSGPFSSGIMKRAIDQGLLHIDLHNIRDYSHDRHHTVDDYPYGGGDGMVLKPDPIFEAVETVQGKSQIQEEVPVILLTPQGRLFSQEIARELSAHSRLMLICGHYEGVDERVREHLATDEISIGDYVLTSGELPAMVVTNAIARLLPGVLGSEMCIRDRPEILLSGDHGQIARWRREQVIRRTSERRPELLDKAELGKEEKTLVARLSGPATFGKQQRSKINANRESAE